MVTIRHPKDARSPDAEVPKPTHGTADECHTHNCGDPPEYRVEFPDGWVIGYCHEHLHAILNNPNERVTDVWEL